jgi:importin subunit beta-1
VTERDDTNESNLGCAAFEAINILIQNATQDCNQLINQLVPVLISRLERTFTFQIVNQEDRENVIEQQALLCGTLQIVTQKLEQQIRPYADKLMELYLQVFNSSSRNATVNEEALMAVGALANAVEADFVKYLQALMPFVFVGLQNWEAHTVCSVAVGVVGDLCRAVGKNITGFCDEIVTLLLHDLQNARLHRSVKPAILSCFGDIALAIGGFFDKYLAVVMAMLQQAKQTRVRDPDDFDEVDFVNSLREGIFETFTGTIQGLRLDGKAALFEPFVELLVSFIEEIWDDPNRSEGTTRGAIGVLGDLAQTLEGRVGVVFNRERIKRVLQECRESSNPNIKEIARWTQGLVQSFKS